MAFRIGRSRRGGRRMAQRAINAMPRMARGRLPPRRTFDFPLPSAPGINITPDMANGLPPGMTSNPMVPVLPRPGGDASTVGTGGFNLARPLPTGTAGPTSQATLGQSPLALDKFKTALAQNPQALANLPAYGSSPTQPPAFTPDPSVVYGGRVSGGVHTKFAPGYVPPQPVSAQAAAIAQYKKDQAALGQSTTGTSDVTNRQMFKNGGVVKMEGGGLIGAASHLIDLGNAVSDELGYIAGGDTYLTSKYGSSTEAGGGEALTAPAGEVQEDNMFTDALMADGGEPLMAMQDQAMMAPPMPEQLPPGMLEQLPPGMPSPQEIGAQMGQAMGPEGMAVLEGGLAQAQASVEALDNAESPEDVINAIRGDEAPISARRAELASLVGEEDAAATPDSVLALVQPVLVMASQSEQGNIDQGIGALASEEMEAPVEGPMADGIMSMMS